VDLEMLFSARSAKEHRAIRLDLQLAYPTVRIDQPILDRAVEVQAILAARGEHRAASIPDLIIAAAAESADLTVIHYDADFDLIAKVTRQPMEWVAPRGSL
jgi:predicted nucleic acid-binding protein